jgi:hypothetical protein
MIAFTLRQKLSKSILTGKLVEFEDKVVSPYPLCTNTTKSMFHPLSLYFVDREFKAGELIHTNAITHQGIYIALGWLYIRIKIFLHLSL